MRSKIALVLRIFLASIVCYGWVTPLFSAEYNGTDIGGGPAGATQELPNGYNLRSSGRDIGGAADQFHFAYQQRTGDFDVQVRVQNLTITDAFVQAGLMVREGLDAGSRFAGVFSSSAQLGTFFESRATASAVTQSVAPPAGFRVNYPEMYLRLRRAGNVFTGYASFDGKTWQQAGTSTLTLPNSVFFGMALASLNTNKAATAEFRDIIPVTAPGTFSGGIDAEPLGPSNRRTGLIISEIMYHPAASADTNELEFVELYNAESIFIDLTGWRISGGIEYEFPEGFRLEAGEFAVVAADPAALERASGLAGVLGPYTGRLNNAGDVIQVLNAADALRIEVEYEPEHPWPAAADGNGHSLALAHPSYGEDDPRAWAGSEIVGGSPGQVDAIRPHPLKSIMINEFLAHTDEPALDFVELYNASNVDVDLSNCILTDDIGTNRFRIPAGTILGPRRHLSFTQNQLAFALSSAGETLHLLDPAATRILDLVRFGGQENGVSSGRAPDGSPVLRRLTSATPGAPNDTRRVEEVVINELMYRPISGEDDDQFVEIHNRSSAAVDLSGWTFTDGIDFEFPEGASIPAGGYVVVARDAARLMTNYPQLSANNTFGNFDGQLSGSGERVALSKRDFVTETNQLGVTVTNSIQIVVSEVSYHDGGRWSELADGGGSSLELMDARADSLQPSNWSASDETRKAPWTTVQVTASLQMGNAAYPANRFQIAMLGAGECLIDDIELIPAGSTNVLLNGDFEGPANPWVFFGNHRGSAIESTGAFAGQNVLHVRAPGDGDTANNSIRGNMGRSLSSGTATIRAKVRWLSGWPEVLMRIRGNWIELPARMEVPKNLGTPGQVNSRRVNNAGPAIYDVTHSPALPRANEPVVVTCRAVDPDGVAAPRILYRVEPNAQLTTVIMRDDGAAGDVLAGDGLYSGTIPGRAAGTLIAFRVQASDSASNPINSIFPPDAPARECLVRWEDTIPFGSFAHYHLWSTAATESARASSPDLDNTYRDATLVYGNTRVIYNAGFRDKGSPYHQGGGDFAVTVPKDQLLLGIDDRVFASTGNGGSESTGMKTDVSGWIGQQLGIPYLHSHFMRLYRNGGRYRDIMHDMEQPNRYFAQSWFGGGGVKDDLFKIAIWFEFDDNNGSFSSTGATLQRFLTGGEYRLARYRWNWQIRPSTDTANDYSSIFNLVTAANSTIERTRTLPLLADMEEWMRVFAFHRIIGNWDSYSYRVGQNMYLYAPLGQQAALLPWDIDFVLGEGDAATTTLFDAGQDGIIQTLFGVPMYRRMLWRAYQDAMNGPMLPQNFQPQVDARRAAQVKNGIILTSPGSITSYLNSRRGYISNQLVRADAPALNITSNGGADFSSTEPTVSLTGFAPFAVATIEVNGVPFPVSWTSLTNWQITVPLGGATNRLQIVGRDLRGDPVASAADTINVQYSGAVPQPMDWVVINEIMYDPAEPEAEFIELHNRHPSFAFDLSAFELSGIGLTLPPGSLIQPNGFLVLAQNRAAFGAAYGALIPVIGPYSGNLQGDGETLRLVRPGSEPSEDLVLDEVRYSHTAPWPALADGLGPSLQLIDPAQDNWRAGNWTAAAPTSPDRATPGRANANRTLIEPFPALWLNEISLNTSTGPADARGERDPWLELYNNGSVNVDLSGLSLTDDPQQLAKWQFPAGSRILPGQFLLVWLDGEPAQSSAAELHTSFRLTRTNGLVIISRAQGAAPAAIDYLDYQITSPQYSFGSYPDGDPRRRRMLYVTTPGAPNDASIPNVEVTINEWMAASQAVLRDPADNQFEDWFEIYNAGTNTVDLSGYFLSDSQSEPLFQIPAGFQIAPRSFRLIWADNEPTQNAPDRDLHVNFSLRADGEEIALFTPDEQLVDVAVFTAQSANISEGRYPDGGEEPFALFVAPTPGSANTAQFANRPPIISPIADSALDEGAVFNLRVTASDLDQPAQQLTFSLATGPEGASMNASTGDTSWATTEQHGPGLYTITVRVTDNGSPARASTVSFRVNVREVNQAPSLAAIPDLTTDESLPLEIVAQAADADFPAQALTFSFVNGAPLGAELNPATGEFTWVPSEAQGPGAYPITIRVTDAGSPALSAARTFNITVRDVNNAPVLPEISAQTVNEGAQFTLQIAATDPEIPPARLVYTIENGPAGMTINADTGVIHWTPDEAAGPLDYNIVVRVSEAGGGPSITGSFVLGVREVNVQPVLDALPDLAVRPGDIVSITNRATDADLPAQTLTFSAVGLPPGAAIHPITGVLSWIVPADPAGGTNRVSVRITDDGSPATFSEQSFNLIVRAAPLIVINEIMHRAAIPGGEYVELANISSVNAVDLGGWRMEGYNFTFPPGTILPANSYLSVARFLTGFHGSYGGLPRAVGDAVVTLPSEGGLVRLIKPASVGGPEEVIDEVNFALAAPWPAALAGVSLQLIDPWEDNRRAANWATGSGTTATLTNTIVPITGAWRYWQDAAPPSAAWRSSAFVDNGWPEGTALFFVEDADVPAPKATALTLGQTTYYFRTRFTFNGSGTGAMLRFNAVLDDGAVFYLNGAEVFRIGMPDGPVDETTFASRTTGNAIFEGPFEVSAAGLQQGENILAVEVHQANAGSSDIVFGTEVQLTSQSPVSHTPSAPNSITRDVPTIPPVWINEVHPVNTTGITDGAGEREPWFELHNASDAAVDLSGWAVSDDLNALLRYGLPLNTIIPARGYLLIWADAEPATDPLEIHSSFPLRAEGGLLVLSLRQNGIPVIADYVQYPAMTNQSFGAAADGNILSRTLLPQSTPRSANGAGSTRPDLRLETLAGGALRITWGSAQGRSYQVEATADLKTAIWDTLMQAAGTGSPLSYTESNPSARARFYRVRTQ